MSTYVKSTQYKKLAKCFAVHILEFEILQNTWKNHQNAKFIDEKLKTKSLTFFVSFFSCDLQDFRFDMWTAKHFAQASCTELTLSFGYICQDNSGMEFYFWILKMSIPFQTDKWGAVEWHHDIELHDTAARVAAANIFFQCHTNDHLIKSKMR